MPYPILPYCLTNQPTTKPHLPRNYLSDNPIKRPTTATRQPVNSFHSYSMHTHAPTRACLPACMHEHKNCGVCRYFPVIYSRQALRVLQQASFFWKKIKKLNTILKTSFSVRTYRWFERKEWSWTGYFRAGGRRQKILVWLTKCS